MVRKIWISILSVLIIVLIVVSVILLRPWTVAMASGVAAGDPAAPGAPSVTGTYYWSFAAKFVCGYQGSITGTGAPLLGEPVIQLGNYASEINIQNPNFKEVPLIKRFFVLVDGDFVHREPETSGPVAGTSIIVPGNWATMDDCNGLWAYTHPGLPVPAFPMQRFIGYLVILSPLDLNVNVVYTASAPGVVGQVTTSASIDVLTVTGKRVFVPTGTNP